MILVASVLFILANIGFEGGIVFYNAFLPSLSKKETYGRISGYGFAMGYVGSLVSLLIAFPLYAGGFADTNLPSVRLSFLIAAGMFFVFSLPLLLYLQGQRGERVIGSLTVSRPMAWPGAILLLGLPVAVVEALFVTSTMGGGWNEYTYGVLLVYGFLVAADSPGYSTLEGPKLYKRNGYYYVFAPAGGVKQGWQSVFRARTITGPYQDRIVLDQGRTEINGPHQGAWVETESGEVGSCTSRTGLPSAGLCSCSPCAGWTTGR